MSSNYAQLTDQIKLTQKSVQILNEECKILVELIAKRKFRNISESRTSWTKKRSNAAPLSLPVPPAKKSKGADADATSIDSSKEMTGTSNVVSSVAELKNQTEISDT